MLGMVGSKVVAGGGRLGSWSGLVVGQGEWGGGRPEHLIGGEGGAMWMA